MRVFLLLNTLIPIKVSFSVYYLTDFIISHLSPIFNDSKKVKIKDVTIAWYHLACIVVSCSWDQVPVLTGLSQKPRKSMKVLSPALVIAGYQQAGGFKSLECSYTHPERPVITSMFHILYSHNPVFKQAATLILLSSNVITFSEVLTTIPMLRKSNIIYNYIYRYIYNIPRYLGYRH